MTVVHFQPDGNASWGVLVAAACGFVGTNITRRSFTRDTHDVTCGLCRRTLAFRREHVGDVPSSR